MSMTIYHFVTTWFFRASIERVWEEIVNVTEWPLWWASWKKAVVCGPASPAQAGSTIDHEVEGRLPYTLRFRTVVTAFEPPRRLTITSSGDLVGVGTFVLEPFNGGTAVTYRWEVGLSNPLLNFLGKVPLARALMEKNHNAVMNEGYLGLKERLER
ncbi:MAG: SRPBCC family protein [Nitrospira sp.]|nr:SRPBCC family protein [Nitrospira sp.]